MEDYRAQDRWTLVPDSRSVGGVDWLPMVERGRRMKPGERIEVVPAEQLQEAVDALREVVRRSEGGRLPVEWVGLPARDALKALGVEPSTTGGR